MSSVFRQESRMQRKTRLSLGVVTVAAAVGAALLPATLAFAAPTFSVTPAASLFNGASTVLTGDGYSANESLTAIECNGATFATYLAGHAGDTTGAALAACDIAGAKSFSANGAGAIPAGTVMAVKSGQLGSDASSVCDHSTNGQCGIGIADGTTQLGQASIAFSEITATPATLLKNGQTISVSGVGLPASTAVSLVECNQAHTDATGSGCNLAGITSAGSTDATGALAGHSFAVKTGQLGSDAASVCSFST